MGSKVTVEYPNGDIVELELGRLYQIHGWNQKVYLKLLRVRGYIAVMSSPSKGKIYEVNAHNLREYKPKPQRVQILRSRDDEGNIKEIRI